MLLNLQVSLFVKTIGSGVSIRFSLLRGTKGGVFPELTTTAMSGRKVLASALQSLGAVTTRNLLTRLHPNAAIDIQLLARSGQGALQSFQSHCFSSKSGDTGSPTRTGPFKANLQSGPAGSNSPEAFGELLASSGISEDDLDSLIALKDFSGIVGLPPLELIEEQDEEMEKKAMRREIERRKQEEIDKSRVKKVDALGRAYATGKRKTSIARVWLMEGEGKFIINGMSHDLYFPNLDNRVHYLEPFVQTKTLGAFDFRSTVKGGGTTGQSGALRHGISKALQLFDPTLRPALKTAGMLTRDSRVVERKKPGKAKARKSFQWVKR
ncbi:unnamed protein product [Sphagnum compactum]